MPVSFNKSVQVNSTTRWQIALVIDGMTDFFATQMKLMRIRRKVDLRIEPHPIGENDFTEINPFANEIQKFGIAITLT